MTLFSNTFPSWSKVDILEVKCAKFEKEAPMKVEDRRGSLATRPTNIFRLESFMKGEPYGRRERDAFSRAVLEGSVLILKNMSKHTPIEPLPLSLLQQAAAKSIIITGPGALTKIPRKDAIPLGYLGSYIEPKVDFRGANLGGVDLQGANLQEANLQEANLQGANLRGADLESANLRGANLFFADLRGANFGEADLRVAGLRGANLLGANLQEAKYNSETKADIDLSERGAIYVD